MPIKHQFHSKETVPIDKVFNSFVDRITTDSAPVLKCACGSDIEPSSFYDEVRKKTLYMSPDKQPTICKNCLRKERAAVEQGRITAELKEMAEQKQLRRNKLTSGSLINDISYMGLKVVPVYTVPHLLQSHIGNPDPWDVIVTTEAGKNIFLTGDAGRGKTTIAIICMLHLWAHHLKTPILVNMIELKRRYLQLLDESGKWEKMKKVQSELTKPDILVLDDLGREKLSEGWMEFLYGIINHRWETNKQIITTSMKGIKSLKKEYDQAIASRLAGKTFMFGGPDWRIDGSK